MSKNIFFTSDYHLGHANIIKYSNRPYSSVEEMNEAIIENHNRCIKKNDDVYFLGDFCFGDANRFLYRLNGNIYFIRGSHDRSLDMAGINMPLLEYINVQVPGNRNQLIALCHTCMRIWDKSHYGSWHLFGHSHGHLDTCNLSFDVGIDSPITNRRPMELSEISLEMKRRTGVMIENGRIITDKRTNKTLYLQDDVRGDYESSKYINE